MAETTPEERAALKEAATSTKGAAPEDVSLALRIIADANARDRADRDARRYRRLNRDALFTLNRRIVALEWALRNVLAAVRASCPGECLPAMEVAQRVLEGDP